MNERGCCVGFEEGCQLGWELDEAVPDGFWDVKHGSAAGLARHGLLRCNYP